MNLLNKIACRIIEARFLRSFFKRSVHFVKKLPGRLRSLLDCFFAIPARLLLCYTSKVDNQKIMFFTFNHAYGCNPKYICEEILRQKLPLQIVWAVKTPQLKSPDFPVEVHRVVRGTYAYFKELVSAKVWVDNAFGFTWNPIPKKKNQFYIQTWHGSLGLKRINKKDVKGLRWSFAAMLNARWVDLCVSNSSFETDVFRQTHWSKNKVEEFGHARNDIFFADGEHLNQIRKKVYNFYGIDEDKKVVLYAPTFRKADSTEVFDLDYTGFLDALTDRFGGEWVLLNRYHDKTKKARKGFKKVSATEERVISATAYPDIQELMVAADVGITDYSSWICDYILTGKPGFLYVPDLHEYDQERGFYYPLEETPFPIAQSNEELHQKIQTFQTDTYKQKLEQFLKARGCQEEGTAAKKIVELIKQQCGLS